MFPFKLEMKLALLFFVSSFVVKCTASDSMVIANQNRVFEIDWSKNTFVKDGEPFRYISGSIHYFRHPRAYWPDRLRKLRAAGFNAVSTYIEWSLHEPRPGEFEFGGEKDFVHFVRLAEAEGLLVILRPGPYICAERDFGGYPSWLLTQGYGDRYMELRTNDSRHTRYVYQWLRHLLPLIQPLLYGNGGPVIMVQVENEYGSYYAHDTQYTKWLRDVFRRYVEDKAVLFTTDGYKEYYLQYGPIPSVFTTVDFGSGGNVQSNFASLRNHQPAGPLVNSEYYSGTLTHWGETPHTVPGERVVATLKDLLDYNVSLNMYMFAGGSNFGFTSGANYGERYEPHITSYDHDAPINEGGDLTEKYYLIRELLSEYVPIAPVPRPAQKGDYGSVIMEPLLSIFDAPSTMPKVRAVHPMSFERLNQGYGFLLYETNIPKNIGDPAVLCIKTLHDRATVYIDKTVAGVLSRSRNITKLSMLARAGQTLRILVENQGRINYGDRFKDFKGILSKVILSNAVVKQWVHTSYTLDNIRNIEEDYKLYTSENNTEIIPPAFYTATFHLPVYMTAPLDTYVDLSGWGKGVLFVNEINLGRYWVTTGPQITLYLPGCFLRSYPELNRITILELEFVNPEFTVKFVKSPIMNGTHTLY